MPGLVARTEPLAPGQAHVDPEFPHGRPRPPGPPVQWWVWRLWVFVVLAPVSAAVPVWTAISEATWRPLGAAVLWVLSGLVSWRVVTRYERSAGAPRDAWRATGGILVALVVYLGGLPFVVP
jgi:hypothetical protein